MRSRIRSHSAPRSTCRSCRMAGTSLMGSVTTTSHPQPSEYWSMRSRLLRKLVASSRRRAGRWTGPSPLLCTEKDFIPDFLSRGCQAASSSSSLFCLNTCWQDDIDSGFLRQCLLWWLDFLSDDGGDGFLAGGGGHGGGSFGCPFDVVVLDGV